MLTRYEYEKEKTERRRVGDAYYFSFLKGVDDDPDGPDEFG
jgi:hypothetical protein